LNKKKTRNYNIENQKLEFKALKEKSQFTIGELKKFHYSLFPLVDEIIEDNVYIKPDAGSHGWDGSIKLKNIRILTQKKMKKQIFN